MAPNPKITRAFRAMKDIGISEEKVKPVLKKLLKLYDKNWELIEEENYRALADAIFDEEEVVEKKKSKNNVAPENFDDETLVNDEPVRPLKRLRLRGQEAPSSSSLINGSPRAGETLLRTPKVEEDETPANSSQQQPRDVVKSLQSIPGTSRTELQPPGFVSPVQHPRNTGKQPVSPKPLAAQDRTDAFQPCATDGNQPSSNRSDFTSPSGQMHAGYKGKEPFSPYVASRDTIHVAEVALHTVQAKDKKKEQGIVVLPRQKITDSHALIKPKDEPYTDELPECEIPIAMVYPDSLNEGGSAVGNVIIGESNGKEPPTSQHVGRENGGDGVQSLLIEQTPVSELATLPVEFPSLEIASSTLGEVKISLSCNSTIGGSNFHLPSLDELRESMEEKCLRSYKIIDPNFSVMKLMKDMCDCFLELATNSYCESQEGIMNITPNLDLLKKPTPWEPLAVGGSKANNYISSRASNEPADVQFFAEETCEELHSLVVVPQNQPFSPDELRSIYNVNDITRGEERLEISWVNDVSNECPPPFYYISQNIAFHNASLNFTLHRIGDDHCCSTCYGDCLSLSSPGVCACQTGGKFAYTSEGLIEENFLEECISITRDPQWQFLLKCKECPLERTKEEEILEPCKGHLRRKTIKECWSKCGCNKQCGNRVVQRGINHKLQVFFLPDGKGWGVRSLEKLPKGAFVCEFVGEILTITELFQRTAEKQTFSVILDAYWDSEAVPKDNKALCLDAMFYGNIARFINHRCYDANLIEIPVEVETPEHHYYHIALFTTREIGAMEELTWDYGIDFDDHEHPLKAFRCLCGSKFCRNMKRSNRSRHALVGR